MIARIKHHSVVMCVVAMLIALPGCDGPPTASERGKSVESNVAAPTTSEEVQPEPDTVDGLIERGRVSCRAAFNASWKKRIELYESAWNDFQKAHKMAGGEWILEFKPWESPDAVTEAALLMSAGKIKHESKGSARALTSAARMCLRLYRPIQAAVLMDAANAIAPNDPYVQLVRLQLDGLGTGDWERVNPELKKLTDNSELSDAATAWFIYGFGLMTAGDYPEAEKAYRRCLELDPTEEGARVNLVQVLAELDRMDEAKALQAEMQSESDGIIYSDLNLGVTLMRKGRFEEAIPILASVTQRAPGLPAGWFNLGGAYSQTGRYEDAIAAYKVFTRMMPDDAGGLGLLAYAHSQSGDYVEAVSIMERAVTLPTASVSSYLTLADAYGGAGRIEEALRTYRKAWEMDETSAYVWHNYGSFLCDQHKASDLVELATAVLKQHSDLAHVYHWRATAYSDLGDLERALADQEKCVELSPDVFTYYTLGFLRKLAGKSHAEIMAALDSALSIYEGHAYASAVYWIVARDAGDAGRAEEVIRRAVAGSSAEDWYGRIVRYLANDLTREEFLGFAADDDQRCEAFYFIAEKTRATRGYDSAREWFKKCTSMGRERFWEHRFSLQILKQHGDA